jgi:hypothetical protein
MWKVAQQYGRVQKEVWWRFYKKSLIGSYFNLAYFNDKGK